MHNSRQGASSLRIVIADDNPDILGLYEDFIHRCFKKAAVITFQDGNAAWQELQRADPDLLIMDINRPGLDGLETLRLLAERKVEYPIMVVSGMGAMESKIKESAGPALNVTYLTKPLTAKDLLSQFHQQGIVENECHE